MKGFYEGMTMKTLMAAALALWAVSLGAAADDMTQAAVDVAAQVRGQGYACADPVSATRDEAASKPDLPVFVLTCANATYSVKVIPDQAAVITKVQ